LQYFPLSGHAGFPSEAPYDSIAVENGGLAEHARAEVATRHRQIETLPNRGFFIQRSDPEAPPHHPVRRRRNPLRGRGRIVARWHRRCVRWVWTLRRPHSACFAARPVVLWESRGTLEADSYESRSSPTFCAAGEWMIDRTHPAAPFLRFLGATETARGSRFLTDAPRARVLAECGSFQRLKALHLRSREAFRVDPDSIDAVLVSHAYVVQLGDVPRLVRLD
jgi:hypothetical protein